MKLCIAIVLALTCIAFTETSAAPIAQPQRFFQRVHTFMTNWRARRLSFLKRLLGIPTSSSSAPAPAPAAAAPAPAPSAPAAQPAQPAAPLPAEVTSALNAISSGTSDYTASEEAELKAAVAQYNSA